MSYDLRLKEPNSEDVVKFDSKHMMAGGTYAAGGTKEAWLNITYNYSRWYYKVFPEEKGIYALNGMQAADSIPVLQSAIDMLEFMTDDLSKDEIESYKSNGSNGYWIPTRSNAIRPLYQLLAMAKMRPDAFWEVC